MKPSAAKIIHLSLCLPALLVVW